MMRNNGEQLTKVREVAEPVLNGLGYDLVAMELTVEHGRKILRLYIDRLESAIRPPLGTSSLASGSLVDRLGEGAEAVGIADCVAATKELSPVFDVAEPIDGRYELEISSPGINRPLARRKDFEKFAGKKVAVRTYEKVGDRRNFLGTLLGIDGEDIRIDVDGREHRVPLAEVMKAHLDVL